MPGKDGETVSRKSNATIARETDALLISILHPAWVERFYRLTMEINGYLEQVGSINSNDAVGMRPINARNDLWRESRLGERYWDALIRTGPRMHTEEDPYARF